MNSELLMANVYTMAINLVYALIAMVIGILALKLIDWLIFPEINFIEEIKKGNIAAAIFSGILILFLAIMLSSAIR